MTRFSKGILLLSFLIPAITLADTVILNNGKTYRNVRAHLGKKKIKITTSNGRIYQYPVSQLKRLIIKPIYKKKVKLKIKQKLKREEKTNKKISSKKRKESVITNRERNRENIRSIVKKSNLKKSEQNSKENILNNSGTDTEKPMTLFFAGLIPGWSGHYSQDRFKLGYFFSISEVIFLMTLGRWGDPQLLIQDPYYLLTGLLIFRQNPGFLNMQAPLPFLIWWGNGNTLVRHPTEPGRFLDQEKYNQSRSGIAIIFLGLLLADALTSYQFDGDFSFSLSTAPATTLNRFDALYISFKHSF